MLTFAFYADPAMTTPLRSALQATQASASPSAQDLLVYFGSRNPARLAVAAGGGAITLTPTGAGAANVRLAKTLAGLDSATPGAAIDLAAEIDGGVGWPIYMRVLDTTGVAGLRAVSFTTSTINEVEA